MIYLFGLLRSEKQIFLGNDGQVTHGAKMEADSSTQKTENTPKFIRPICPIGSKVWDIFGKRLYRASVVHPSYYGFKSCHMARHVDAFSRSN